MPSFFNAFFEKKSSSDKRTREEKYEEKQQKIIKQIHKNAEEYRTNNPVLFKNVPPSEETQKKLSQRSFAKKPNYQELDPPQKINKAQKTKQPTPKTFPDMSEKAALFFENTKDIKRSIRQLLKNEAPLSAKEIDHHIIASKNIYVSKLENEAYKSQHLKRHFAKLRNELKKENIIDYDSFSKKWTYVEVVTKELTNKAKNYLKYGEKVGDGWKQIDNEDAAIHWMKQNFSPDQFEAFCCSILEHWGLEKPQISEKRPISGADGGIDGYGYHTHDGEKKKFIIQVKLYKPSAQITTDQIQQFLGAYDTENVEYGFFISTCSFSERSLEIAENINKNPDKKKKIGLIDKDLLIKIMLSEGRKTKGFGLYKTEEYGVVYINEHILNQAAQI